MQQRRAKNVIVDLAFKFARVHELRDFWDESKNYAGDGIQFSKHFYFLFPTFFLCVMQDKGTLNLNAIKEQCLYISIFFLSFAIYF